MKKTSIILTLAAMLVAMVSCTKEEQPVSGKFTMTVNADKGTRATKDLSLDGTTLNATWKAGEKVNVYKGWRYLGTLTAATDGSTTTLSGTINVPDGVTIAENDVLTLKFLSGAYGSQNGTLASIAANCDYAVATVTISGISGSSVSTSDAVFENQQAIVKFTLQKSDGSDLPSNPTALTVDYGNSSVDLSFIHPTTYTTNGDGVLYVAIPGFSNQRVILTAAVGFATYVKVVNNVTFTNGQYYTVTAGLEELTTVTWTSWEGDISSINLSSGSSSTTIKGITASIAGYVDPQMGEPYSWSGSTITPSDYTQVTFSGKSFWKIEIKCNRPAVELPSGWSYSDSYDGGKLVWQSNGGPQDNVSLTLYSSMGQISGIEQIDFTVQ